MEREVQGYKGMHVEGNRTALARNDSLNRDAANLGTATSVSLNMARIVAVTWHRSIAVAGTSNEQGKRWTIYLGKLKVSKRVPHQPRTHPCSRDLK